jgi:hypothetical protein
MGRHGPFIAFVLVPIIVDSVFRGFRIAKFAIRAIAPNLRRNAWIWGEIWQEAHVMRVPRVRFTVRWMMVAVAVVAMGLGVRAQLSRWQQLARYYAIEAGRLRRSVLTFRAIGEMSQEQWIAHYRAADERSLPGPLTYYGWAERYGEESAGARRHADYLDLLRKKYQRAAAQPWWPVEPDPPPPHYGSQ